MAARRAVDGRERERSTTPEGGCLEQSQKSEEKSYMQSADSLGQDDLAN